MSDEIKLGDAVKNGNFHLGKVIGFGSIPTVIVEGGAQHVLGTVELDDDPQADDATTRRAV